MHLSTIAVCRKNLEGKCDYLDDMCWWNHNARDFNSDQICCYVCNHVFGNRTDMMKHRKQEHPEMVMPCRKFQNNSCYFQDAACWYIHEKKKEDNFHYAHSEEEAMDVDSVFQNVSENLEPPLSTNQKTNKSSERI